MMPGTTTVSTRKTKLAPPAASAADPSSSSTNNKSSMMIQVQLQLPVPSEEVSASSHRLPPQKKKKPKEVSFSLSVADLQKREYEMQQTANEFDIPMDRWKGSRLYCAWKAQKRKQKEQSATSTGTSTVSNNRMILKIDPTQHYQNNHNNNNTNSTSSKSQETASSPLSATPWWQSWLALFLQQYYQTGKLIVSKDCQGPDLLFCLESFGILYAPSQLHFSTAAPYWKIKYWSEYLTHRPIFAEQILESMEYLHNQQQQHEFQPTSSSSSTTPMVFFWGTTLHAKESLSVSLKQLPDPSSTNHLPTIHPWSTERDVAKLVFTIFNDSTENTVAQALRQDFARYLAKEYIVVGPDDLLKAEFTCKSVQIAYDGNPVGRERRAILRIEWKEQAKKHSRKNSADKQLSATYDEHGMIQEKDPVVMYAPVNPKQRPTPKKKGRASSPALNNNRSPTDVKEELQYATRTPMRSSHRRGRQSPLTMSQKQQQQRSSPLRANAPPSMGGFMMMHPAALGMPAPPPVDEIDAEDGHTVVSGLTSPFATDLDSVLGTPRTKRNEYRAEAKRQEWVQGTLLTKDVPQEMRRLLEEDEYEEEQEDYKQKEVAEEKEASDDAESFKFKGILKESSVTSPAANPPRTPPRAKTPLHYEKAIANPQTPEQLRAADDPIFQDSPTPDCSWDWMNKLCQPQTSSMTAATETTTTTVWTADMCVGDACDPQPDVPTVKTVSQSSQSASKTTGSSARKKSIVQDRMDRVQKMKLEKTQNGNNTSKQANSGNVLQKENDTINAKGGNGKKFGMGKLFGRNKKQ